MKDRIKQYMDYKSISAGELSSRLDVQRSNISHILNGRNKPGASFIEKLLLSFPDLNARWLFTGDGEMTESKVSNKIIETSNVKDSAAVEPVMNKENELPFMESINSNQLKPIDKVVLLFTDGTFTDFRRK